MPSHVSTAYLTPRLTLTTLLMGCYSPSHLITNHRLLTLRGPVSYDADGHTTTTALDNHRYRFDGLGQLLHSQPPAAKIAAAQATTNSAQTPDSWAESFVYDGLGRLIAIDRRSLKNPTAPATRSFDAFHAGQLYLPASGLQQLGARWLRPALVVQRNTGEGRFANHSLGFNRRLPWNGPTPTDV